MEAVSREVGVLKLVHPGGFVEVHYEPIRASVVMDKNPRHFVTRPDVFRFPWIVVRPESVLKPGCVFLIVPCLTLYRLLKSAGSPPIGRVSTRQERRMLSSERGDMGPCSVPGEVINRRTSSDARQSAAKSRSPKQQRVRSSLTRNTPSRKDSHVSFFGHSNMEPCSVPVELIDESDASRSVHTRRKLDHRDWQMSSSLSDRCSVLMELIDARTMLQKMAPPKSSLKKQGEPSPPTQQQLTPVPQESAISSPGYPDTDMVVVVERRATEQADSSSDGRPRPGKSCLKKHENGNSRARSGLRVRFVLPDRRNNNPQSGPVGL